jgi:hypothetical protein
MTDQSLEQAASASVDNGSNPQPRATQGRFASPYAERRGEAIALRLPQSLDQSLREIVGWQSKADNSSLKAWVEAAIAEKLERHQTGG